MRILLSGLAALLLSGCNADLQQMARASCALTTECYAPGVAPGTNPYRNNYPKSPSVKQSKYVIPVKGSCPQRYNRLGLLRSETGRTYGDRICHYG